MTTIPAEPAGLELERRRADALLGSLLWKLAVVSCFLPAFSPVLAETARPPLSVFFVPLLALQQSWRLPRRWVWLAAWGAWTFVSYAINDGRTTTLLVYLFFIFTVAVLHGALVHASPEAVRKTFQLIVGAGVANALLGVAEAHIGAVYDLLRPLNNCSFYSETTNLGGWISESGFSLGGNVRAAGLCMEPGFYAAVQSLTIPFCLVLAPRRFLPRLLYGAATLLPIGLSIFVSFGRTGWLALLAGAACFGLYLALGRFRTSLKLAMIVAAVALATQLGEVAQELELLQEEAADMDFSIQQRLFSIVGGVEITAAHPLLGIGCGNVMKMEGLVDAQEYGWVPSILNLYVNVATESGLPAAILLAGFLLATVLDVPLTGPTRRPEDRAVLAALFFLLFVWVNLPDVRMTFFALIVALATAAGRKG